MSYLSKYKTHFFVLLAFLFFTWLFFPRIFTGFFTTVETNDGRLLAWTVSWDLHKLFSDPAHLYQANIFFPNKNTLVYSEHAIATSILAIPVWFLTGGNPAACFNFLMILGYVLNAYCTFLLIRKLTGDNAAAFFGACINGFCSYRLLNIAHLQNIIVFYIPLCVLFFYYYLDTKRWKYLVGMGCCLLLQSLSSWYHMIFIFLLFFLLVFYYFIVGKRLTLKEVTGLLLTAGITFLFIAPFAIPYMQHNKETNAAYNMSELISADWGGYFLPSPYSSGNGLLHDYFGISKGRWSENFNFVGYVALLLSLLGLCRTYRNEQQVLRWQYQRERTVYVLVAVVFFICSMGPYFVINDHATGLKLPYYYIFRLLSPIRFLRAVARYSTVVFLMVSILAAYGLINLLKGIDVRLYRRAVYLLLLAVCFLEYAPVPRFDRFSDMGNIPEVYQRIKQDSAVKSIIELPINVGPFTTTKYIYYAGIHYKPMVNGYSGYEPKSYAQIKSAFDFPLNGYSAGLLEQWGVTHILCDPDYKDPLDTAFADLVMEKDGYRLYRVKAGAVQHSVFYAENFTETGGMPQTNDSSFHVYTQLDKASFHDAGGSVPFGYLCPTDVKIPGVASFRSNKPLDKVEVEFRAYLPTDTVLIECIRRGVNDRDSVVRTYTYSNSGDYLDRYLSIDLNKASEVRFRMYSTGFADRALIKNIIFTIQ